MMVKVSSLASGMNYGTSVRIGPLKNYINISFIDATSLKTSDRYTCFSVKAEHNLVAP